MAKVRLEDVSRQFGQVSAIEEIDFTVPDGQFWVLLGPSGCGKSTILRSIAGLETVTSGKIYIGDILVNEVPARQRDVAMVFQNYALYPHMTVAENLAFGLKMRRIDPATISQRVNTVARSLAIEHLLKRKPKQLSGGQQQRVALGRAIARQAQVFLLDEPLSNLDAQLRDDTRAELKQLHDRLGITTIYVTHDQVEAMTLADRIIILDRGRIQQIGTPQQIYSQPDNRMVATFLGTPPMNILPATYHQQTLQIAGQSLPVLPQVWKQLQPQEGEGFDVGIRPEHLEIVSETDNEPHSGRLQVLVEVVEPLGKETLVRCSLPETETILNLYTAASGAITPGDHLTVQLALEQLFIFEPSTGVTLYPTP